jgi:pimeloyl-ACP methyl ester carboxylesterase
MTLRIRHLFVIAIGACTSVAPPPEQVTVSEGTAVTPDSVRLYYRVAGAGEQTVIAPFALFHGSSLDSLARGRRIVTYDPRGRGRSDSVPPPRVSFDLLLSDLETIRNAVGADSVAIIGWSGAGMETFVYALRNPGRVTRLVQLAPVAPRFMPYGPQMGADRARRTDSVALAALNARVSAGEFTSAPVALCRARRAIDLQPLFADTARWTLAPDVCEFPNELPSRLNTYFGALFQTLGEFDWRDSLSAVTIPRLVIHGAVDNTPLEGNREWVTGQPNARLVVIEGAGHWPHYEQPAATLRAIDTFLSGSWPSDTAASAVTARR